MNRYYGTIGFVDTVETAPGVWDDNSIVERKYYGEITRNSRRWSPSSSDSGDTLVINNSLNILADDYLINNLQKMRYVEWLDSKWSIADFDLEYPHINITLGGRYNG